MVKSNKFTISGKNYSFKKGTLIERKVPPVDGQTREPYSYYTMEVFYYKKKDDLITACYGMVWDYMPQDLTEQGFIERYRSHYGPNMLASYDGEHYNGDDNVYDNIVAYVTELKPILEKYPDIPAGYDGWWKNP